VAEPFLSEIRMMSFGFAPSGWALCNGQLLPINQNQALFSLLLTNYGGDGRVNFGLPNLQGRTPMHTGNGHVLGEVGGEQNHQLSISEIPTHFHSASGSSSDGGVAIPVSGFLAKAAPANPYIAPTSITSAMNAGTLATVGGSQPHPNMQPFLTINFCIALQGIFPSQN
jgi:microcystin-dependent protein